MVRLAVLLGLALPALLLAGCQQEKKPGHEEGAGFQSDPRGDVRSEGDRIISSPEMDLLELHWALNDAFLVDLLLADDPQLDDQHGYHCKIKDPQGRSDPPLVRFGWTFGSGTGQSGPSSLRISIDAEALKDLLRSPVDLECQTEYRELFGNGGYRYDEIAAVRINWGDDVAGAPVGPFLEPTVLAIDERGDVQRIDFASGGTSSTQTPRLDLLDLWVWQTSSHISLRWHMAQTPEAGQHVEMVFAVDEPCSGTTFCVKRGFGYNYETSRAQMDRTGEVLPSRPCGTACMEIDVARELLGLDAESSSLRLLAHISGQEPEDEALYNDGIQVPTYRLKTGEQRTW